MSRRQPSRYRVEKRTSSEGTGRWRWKTNEEIRRRFSIYLVIDGHCRVDSFLEYKNAMARLRVLRSRETASGWDSD